MGAEADEPKSDSDALSPEAVQLALSTVCLACEQFLQEPDQVVFLDEIENLLQVAAEMDPHLELDPGLCEQVQRIQQEFQKARYLVRVNLQDPPTDLMT